MAYQKTVWKDQDVENPRTYIARDNGDDTITLLDAFGEVTELGTPVNAENMNHIEDGIAEVDSTTVHKTGDETITGSKIFSSSPIVPTATSGDNSTKAASTAFVANVASGLQTSIDAKANNNAVVHLTGSEIIAGIKTFSNETRLRSVESAGEHGQLRLVTESYGTIFRNDGINTYIFPTARNDPYGTWSSTDKGLSIGNSDGVVSVRGQYGKGAAISDMGKSKAQDDTAYNYIKLSNGLLIQWGKFQNTGTNNYALTFPHPFVNTFWRMITQDAGQISGYSYAGVTGIKDRTTTGCTLYSYYHSRYYDWIAIGYWY